MEATLATHFQLRTFQEPARAAADDHALGASLTVQDTMLGTVEGLLSRIQAHLERSRERDDFDWYLYAACRYREHPRRCDHAPQPVAGAGDGAALPEWCLIGQRGSCWVRPPTRSATFLITQLPTTLMTIIRTKPPIAMPLLGYHSTPFSVTLHRAGREYPRPLGRGRRSSPATCSGRER